MDAAQYLAQQEAQGGKRLPRSQIYLRHIQDNDIIPIVADQCLDLRLMVEDDELVGAISSAVHRIGENLELAIADTLKLRLCHQHSSIQIRLRHAVRTSSVKMSCFLGPRFLAHFIRTLSRISAALVHPFGRKTSAACARS
jgi:hypothetical protein